MHTVGKGKNYMLSQNDVVEKIKIPSVISTISEKIYFIKFKSYEIYSIILAFQARPSQ